MPRIYKKPRILYVEDFGEVEDWGRTLKVKASKPIDFSKGIKNITSRNQPLAPGKPARRRAKGHAARRRRKAGKGSGKK